LGSRACWEAMVLNHRRLPGRLVAVDRTRVDRPAPTQGGIEVGRGRSRCGEAPGTCLTLHTTVSGPAPVQVDDLGVILSVRAESSRSYSPTHLLGLGRRPRVGTPAGASFLVSRTCTCHHEPRLGSAETGFLRTTTSSSCSPSA
jgi:hypothetical protein